MRRRVGALSRKDTKISKIIWKASLIGANPLSRCLSRFGSWRFSAFKILRYCHFRLVDTNANMRSVCVCACIRASHSLFFLMRLCSEIPSLPSTEGAFEFHPNPITASAVAAAAPCEGMVGDGNGEGGTDDSADVSIQQDHGKMNGGTKSDEYSYNLVEVAKDDRVVGGEETGER